MGTGKRTEERRRPGRGSKRRVPSRKASRQSVLHCATRIFGYVLKTSRAGPISSSYVAYKIEVVLTDCRVSNPRDREIARYDVRHRYNDFKRLIKQVQRNCGAAAVHMHELLPPAFLRNKRCDVIMSRCHAFDSMLDAMLAVPAVANSRYLRYFLNVDDHTRRPIALAPPDEHVYAPAPVAVPPKPGLAVVIEETSAEETKASPPEAESVAASAGARAAQGDGSLDLIAPAALPVDRTSAEAGHPAATPKTAGLRPTLSARVQADREGGAKASDDDDARGGDGASEASSVFAASVAPSEAASEASMPDAQIVNAFMRRARTIEWQEAVDHLKLKYKVIKIPNKPSASLATRYVWLDAPEGVQSSEWKLQYSKTSKGKNPTGICLGDVQEVCIGKGSKAFHAHRKAMKLKERRCMSIFTFDRTYDFEFGHARACVDFAAAVKRLTVVRHSVKTRWQNIRTAAAMSLNTK